MQLKIFDLVLKIYISGGQTWVPQTRLRGQEVFKRGKYTVAFGHDVGSERSQKNRGALFTYICVYSPGVCSGQSAVCGGSDDLERGAKGVEPPGGQLRGAGGELQQTRQLLLREAGHHRPEPLHHLRQGKSERDQTFASAVKTRRCGEETSRDVLSP